MKKKVVLVVLLAALLTIGASADHPKGWGLGIEGQYNLAWDGFSGAGGVAFSLKAPQLPVFWGINLEFRNHLFGITVTGDHYFIDRTLVKDINLGWYLGLGAYGGFWRYNYASVAWNSFRFGARLPIGLSWQPLKFLEIFLDVAPSLGVGIYTGDYRDNFNFPEGGLALDVGLRLWI
jgi:hypothetical protein